MGIVLQKNVFISDGKETDYEARFVFHGFRYVRVTGLTDAKPEDFTAVVLSTNMADAGTFACSDERLNRLYQNTRWSQCSNMLSIPTDCPQREKAGWTGDISLYAKTSLLNADTTAFLTRWLASLACDQRENGSVPFTVPDTSIYHYSGLEMGEATGCGGPVTSAGWGDAAVMVPWAMYEVTGNTDILKVQYGSMKAWCDYVISRLPIHAAGSSLPDEVEELLWNTGFQFGEWLIPSQAGEPFEKIQETMAKSSSYTAPIFGWLAVDRFARIAAVLEAEKAPGTENVPEIEKTSETENVLEIEKSLKAEKVPEIEKAPETEKVSKTGSASKKEMVSATAEDARYYGELAERMKDAIQKGLIGENGYLKVERQGAYVLMLAFDLVPQPLMTKFADRLAELIHQNGDCLDTGFLPTPFLLDALCKAGHRELAYTLLYQEKAPSWLGQVKAGATTIWESWVMYLPDGTPKCESFNHYTYGTVDDWMFRNLAGIDQKGVGFRHLIFHPQPDESLSWAKRSFMTEQGEASICWRKENGSFSMDITVPCNTTATVILPDGESREIGSGRYHFRMASG